MAEQRIERVDEVGIVGCGTMGAGIAELIARNGLTVRFAELDDAAVASGMARIDASLQRQIDRGRLTADERDAVLARISGSTRWDDLAPCDLIIEAVPEVLSLKQEAFRRIDDVARPEAIVATNTSSLPVMDIAVHASRPDRVLGFHFFNPAPVMPLIELVRTVVTDDRIIDVARRFASSIGKVPVVVGDRRGFIVNRLLFPYLNQAVWMVESGYATKEDVDAAMRLGAGLPMGPIGLTDLVGIDTFLGIMDAIHGRLDDTRYAPRPMLGHLARAGFTGRKAGRGFYRYDAPDGDGPLADEDTRPAPDVRLVGNWRTVGIVGSGTMAAGIAEVCALAGFDVVLRGRTRQKAEAAAARVSASLQRSVDEERITEDRMVEAMARIQPTIEFGDLVTSDIVIEAVVDDPALKRSIFRELAAVLRPGTPLTTTTSALPVIGCAMATDTPERVLGLHFFNPPPAMRLVEIVTTVRSDPAVVELARAFVARLDRVGVLCGDRAGFIVGTLLFPYLNDAVKMLGSHYATAEQIDTAMKLGCGYPMGPFELMDVVGLDVTLAVLEQLKAEFRQPAYEPAPLLRNLVDAGFLGRKAGRGFYVHR